MRTGSRWNSFVVNTGTMRTRLLQLSFFFISFFSSLLCIAQDSTINGWNISSKKIGENRFELIFTVPVSGGWQLYAPNQTLLEVKTTELKFVDSVVVQEGDFVLTETPRNITSPVFESSVAVYE